MPKIKHKKRKKRSDLATYAFICPICEKRIIATPTQDLGISSRMTIKESAYLLKLAHIRHHHTNYNQHLQSIMIWKKIMLKELKEKKLEVLEEFKLCEDRINEKFASARLKLQKHYKEESKKMLEASPKVVYTPMTKDENKKLRQKMAKGKFGFDSWVASKKRKRK